MQSREKVNRSESGEYTDVELYKLTATFSEAKDQTRLVGQLPWTEILSTGFLLDAPRGNSFLPMLSFESNESRL